MGTNTIGTHAHRPTIELRQLTGFAEAFDLCILYYSMYIHSCLPCQIVMEGKKCAGMCVNVCMNCLPWQHDHTLINCSYSFKAGLTRLVKMSKEVSDFIVNCIRS